MLRVISSYVEMHLSLISSLAKRVFIRCLLIIKVAVGRMDGLVVSNYWFMIDLTM